MSKYIISVEMKKIFLCLLCFIIFTGCSGLYQETTEESQYDIQSDQIALDQEDETEFLDASIKDDVIHLRALWKAFDETRQNDVDPTEHLKNSKYLSELKNFLNKRESLEVSSGALGQLLKQSDYSAVDQTITLGSKTYQIRIIGYCVDFHEQVLTDMQNIKNKWIFVQCWNEDEFYFNTLSDGDVHYFTDFIPFQTNNNLYILVAGNAYPYGPYPGFAWVWRLEKEGFCPGNVFDSQAFENKDYVLDHNTSFDTSTYKAKWMLHTNGSYLFVEKGEKVEKNAITLLNISCKVDEQNKAVSFISSNTQGDETTIQLRLIKDKFRVIIP